MQNKKKVQKRSKARKASRSRQRGRNNQSDSWFQPLTKRQRVIASRANNGFTSSAPIAVSNDLQQFVTFDRGSKENTLRMSCCIPLYQICSNSYAASNLNIGGLSRDSSTNFASVSIGALGGTESDSTTDVNQLYLSPVLQLQGSSFVRYAMTKCMFVYEPQSPTTVSDRLVFAYANDPDHPMINPDGTIPSQATLLALSDSVAFAPWRSWSLDVSKTVRQDLLYTSPDSTNPDLNRFSYFGAIGCVPSIEPTSNTPVTVYGILYGCFEIEFREFCPLIQGFTPSTLTRIKSSGYTKRCSDPKCKACVKLCLNKATTLKENVGDAKASNS